MKRSSFIDRRKQLRDLKTLVFRVAAVAGIVVALIFLYRYFFPSEKASGWEIEDTPLHVEEIRKIIELNTVRFRDEAVVDSVEYYKNSTEQISGNLDKLIDPDQFKHAISSSNVKRRLTMVVKGELLYGVDLKRKEFRIVPEEKRLILHIPEPELLSVNLTPGNTEVFVENGIWEDYERQVLYSKARRKMIVSGEKLGLTDRAKVPLERLLRHLIQTDKELVFQYD